MAASHDAKIDLLSSKKIKNVDLDFLILCQISKQEILISNRYERNKIIEASELVNYNINIC